MAIVKYGATVVGLRGTFGGGVYSANKAGPYVRAWSKPPNPRSDFQTGQRATLAWVAGTWRALTPIQRSGWDSWAALPGQAKTNSLGLTYYCSGFQWYVCINTRLEIMGRTWRTAPPTLPAPSAPFVSSATVYETPAGGTGYITYPSGQWTGYDSVIFVALRTLTGSATAYPGFYLCKVTTAPGATSTYFSILMRDHLGYTIPGNTYHVRAYRQTTEGMRSAPATTSGVST